MNTRKTIAATLAAAAIAASLAACGNSDQRADLLNSGTSYPDWNTTVLNVDGFPNISVICFKGAGFATTSRNMDAILRVPAWDAFCATKHATARGPAS